MKSFIVFGLTGCIGSGKSTAASFMSQMGYAIVDADDLAREVVQPGTDGLNELVSTFGETILKSGGELDRGSLGKIIFNNPSKRKEAEKILHPKIRTSWLSRLNELKKSRKNKAAVYVVPLLFESGADYKEIDAIIAINSSPETSIKRVMARSNLSREEIVARLSSQLTNEAKCSRSDFVLDNSGSTSDLERLIKKWDEIITSRFHIN